MSESLIESLNQWLGWQNDFKKRVNGTLGARLLAERNMEVYIEIGGVPVRPGEPEYGHTGSLTLTSIGSADQNSILMSWHTKAGSLADLAIALEDFVRMTFPEIPQAV